MGEWIDLRADDGRLYGRLERTTLQLEIQRGDHRVIFDLISTVRDRRPVSQRSIDARSTASERPLVK